MPAHQMRYSGPQVWHWLTDIAAMRGEDGLDDRFDRAEEQATEFRRQMDELRVLRPDQATTLDAVNHSFDMFYEAGQWMARHYVEGGTSAGNDAMRTFHASGADIAERLQRLVEGFDADADAALTEANRATGNTR
jgi:methyl-accepting chemotaxis protein